MVTSASRRSPTPASVSLRRLAVTLAVVIGVGCGSTSSSREAPLGDSPVLPLVVDEASVSSVVETVRRDHFPDLAGVTVVVRGFDGTGDFFTADVALDTVSKAPRERTYRVNVNRALYGKGLGNRAVYAILTHELKHVRDYVGMDEKTLVDFAVNYALSPATAYERATDLFALEEGVGRGLRDFRLWLYDHVDEETRAAKVRDYWTPDEIADWLRAHPDADRLP